jgi:hypothetical protein
MKDTMTNKRIFEESTPEGSEPIRYFIVDVTCPSCEDIRAVRFEGWDALPCRECNRLIQRVGYGSRMRKPLSKAL